jgi:hypothetical protein
MALDSNQCRFLKVNRVMELRFLYQCRQGVSIIRIQLAKLLNHIIFSLYRWRSFNPRYNRECLLDHQLRWTEVKRIPKRKIKKTILLEKSLDLIRGMVATNLTFQTSHRYRKSSNLIRLSIKATVFFQINIRL